MGCHRPGGREHGLSIASPSTHQGQVVGLADEEAAVLGVVAGLDEGPVAVDVLYFALALVLH